MLVWLRERRPLGDGFPTSLRLFVRVAMAFPVAVTACVGVVLLFGGVVAAWIWWTTLAATLAWMSLCHAGSWRSRLAACGLFLIFLALIWIVAGLGLNVGWLDVTNYHFPATRLLIEGWNPIYAATPEALASTMDVNPWEMRLWHVLAMPKAVWYFSASAYTFTDTPLNLQMALFPFLFVTAASSLWRYFDGRSVWIRLGALVCLWCMVPSPLHSMVDTASLLGAIGLLAGFGVMLRGKREDWMALVVHSFWMAASKQVAAYACVLFWLFFSIAWLWQERRQVLPAVRRLSYCAVVIGGLLALTGVSPYVTSWLNYGHPLYPVCTVDEAKYPTYDIVADFKACNSDATAMGRLGSFVNAYVSQSVAHAYYRWKLGKADFRPWRTTWVQGGDAGGPRCLRARLGLIVLMLLTLAFGKRTERILGGMLLLVLVLMPLEMIGYDRYSLWAGFSVFLALYSVTGWRMALWKRTCACLIGVCVAAVAVKESFRITLMLDAVYAADRFLSETPPTVIYGFYAGGISLTRAEDRYHLMSEAAAGHPAKTTLCNLRLLCRQEPRLRNVKVEYLDAYGEDRELWPTFQDKEFKLPVGTDVNRFSLFMANAKEPDRVRRILRYPVIMLKVWFVRFPVLLAERLCSLSPPPLQKKMRSHSCKTKFIPSSGRFKCAYAIIAPAVKYLQAAKVA